MQFEKPGRLKQFIPRHVVFLWGHSLALDICLRTDGVIETSRQQADRQTHKPACFLPSNYDVWSFSIQEKTINNIC